MLAMRSPAEQEDYLESGRFEPTRSGLPKFDRSIWIGLLGIASGCAIFGAAVALGIGRDDGGPLFVIWAAGCAAAGSLSIIASVLRRWIGRSR